MSRNSTLLTALFISLITGTQLAAAPSVGASTFEEVESYLEKDGVIYGIVDLEGDIAHLSLKLEEMLQRLSQMNPQMAMAASFPASTLIEQTGLTAIRAIGISSTRRDPGFENRTIILTEDGLPGLLGFYGRENQPFMTPRMAPAGTDMLAETSMHPDILIDTIRKMAITIMGENGGQMIDLQLGRPLGNSPFTAGELLRALEGQYMLIADVSETETMTLPKVGAFPKVDFMVQLQSAGTVIGKIESLLNQLELPNFKSEKAGDIITMTGFLPAGSEFDVILQANQSSGEMVITSSLEYLATCRISDGPRLIDTAPFQEATTGLSEQGISLSYVTPGINRLITGYMDVVLRLDSENGEAMRPYMEWAMGNVMMEFPMASVISVEESGIFTQSHWNASHKRNLAVLAYANPVTVGLMAAMAIPAFQKVRATSQQKAITNNLRQLASAAQQKMLEEGVMSVRTEDLIGPDAYIYALQNVMGETYPEVITAEMTEIQAVLPNGETVIYQF